MLLNGKLLSLELQKELKAELLHTKEKPCLCFILVGDHPASTTYVKAKTKACQYVGIDSKIVHLPSAISEMDLLLLIQKINQDPQVHGILVQLPLPPHINESKVIVSIHPGKDVDGFHPLNMGKLLIGEEKGPFPCTPLGVQTLLHRFHIPLQGKHVVILGRSNIVGKPLAALLMQKKEHANATVTVAHSQSENLKELTLSADILIAALGRPRYITKEFVKPGAVVVDVGIHRLANGSLTGDVDFEDVQKQTKAITPVPGGVGPMTIAMLLKNTLSCFRHSS